MSVVATQYEDVTGVACPHLGISERGPTCSVAASLSGLPGAVPVTQEHCRRCLLERARTNRVTIGLALVHLKREDEEAYQEARPRLLTMLHEQSPAGSAIAKATRYAKSTAEWIAAGRPVRPNEEVERILRMCQSDACGYYEPRGDDRGMCRACGCMLNLYGGLFNKIRRATEHCPKEYW